MSLQGRRAPAAGASCETVTLEFNYLHNKGNHYDHNGVVLSGLLTYTFQVFLLGF